MLQWFENVFTGLGMMTKKPLISLCDIRVADDRYVYIPDGTIMSFIRVNGGFKSLSYSEQEEMRGVIRDRLMPFFAQPGHNLDCCYRMDPALASAQAEELAAVWRGGAKTLNLDFDEVIRAKERLLADIGNPEENIWCLWTTPVSLTKEEYKYQLLAHEKTISHMEVTTGQSLEGVLSFQEDKHRPAVIAVIDTLRAAGVDAEQLSPEVGLKYAFASNNPAYQMSGFEPITLASDTTYTEDERLSDTDLSGFTPPPLNEQMFVGDGFRHDQNVFQIGQTLWGYFTMKVGPKPERPFGELVSELNQTKTPWRIKLQLAGGEPASLAINQSLAFAARSTNPTTERLYRAIQDVKADRASGIARVSFSVSFSTWCKAPNKKQLYDQLAKLHAAVTQWGGIFAMADAGDAAEGVLSSNLGLSYRSVAVKAAPRLESALKMLPLFRVGCPFKRPSLLFRTADGGLWPYEVGSPALTRFMNIYVGEPGLGKSALLNSVNNASILSKASEGEVGQIPYMGILDIGPSSKGLIEEYRQVLPDHKKHLALYVKLQNDSTYAVNVFDTPVGLRKPLPNHRDFLIQFLGALLVGGDAKDGDNIVRTLSVLVDEVYSLRSDEREPNNYTEKRDAELDKLLVDLNIERHGKSWWEISDTLFISGYDREAAIAQRYAVPTLPDLGRVLAGDRLSNLVGKIVSETGSSLIDQMQLILRAEAAKMPILFRPTAFEFDGARLISLDLQDVIPRTRDPQSNKMAEIMYMLGRHLVAGELYMSETEFDKVAEPYRSYHKKRIAADRSQMRFLSYDEFHRTNGRPYVRNIITADGREARKYNIHINLASQLIDDFDDDTLAMATGIFILGAQDESVRKHIGNRLSLTEASLQNMRNVLHGPGPLGAPFIGIFKTKKGEYQHLLYHNMSAAELWMLTTTDEDVRLKERLSEHVGVRQARKILAQHYPNGTAKEQIKAMEYKNNRTGKGHNTDAIGSIVSSLLKAAA